MSLFSCGHVTLHLAVLVYPNSDYGSRIRGTLSKAINWDVFSYASLRVSDAVPRYAYALQRALEAVSERRHATFTWRYI